MLDILTLDMLLPDTCHLHANTWHLSVSLDNWCVIHLAPDMLLLDTCSLLWHDLSPAIYHVNTWPM